MALRDFASKVFSKPKTPLRDTMNEAAQAPNQIAARDEKAQQQRELKADQEARADSDRQEALAKAALEKPEPVLTPDGASQVKSRGQIERQAGQLVDVKHQQERDAIDRKGEAELLADAADRQQREADAQRDEGVENPSVEPVDAVAKDHVGSVAKIAVFAVPVEIVGLRYTLS